MTVELEYKGQLRRRTSLSAEAAYVIGAKAFYVYRNLLDAGDLRVRIINSRGEVMSVMQQEVRPP